MGRGGRHERSALLQVVGRRPPQRVHQLRRSPSRGAWRQGRAGLGTRARRGGDPAHHLLRAAPARKRIRRPVTGLLRRAATGSCDLPPSDGARAARVDARVRPSGSHPLGGLRRLQRRRMRPAHGGRQEHDPRDDGRLLPRRKADRPQGQSRRGGRGRAQGGDRGREDPGLAAHPGRVPLRIGDGRGPRLLRR